MKFWKCLWIASALGFCASAWCQAYPTARPVRIIVPAGAGSATDVLARMVADKLSQTTQGKFIVENRVGAGGNIGLAAGARATPDGYTLIFGNLGANVVNQFIYPKLDFDPEKDFDNVAMVALSPFIICVPASFPVNSLAELVTAAKAKPGTINVALTGTVVRIVHEQLKVATGAELFPIPYPGPAPGMTDVLSGRIQVLFETLGAGTLRPMIAAGRIKPLAVTTRTTSSLMPGIKSVAEQGFPEFGEVVGWIALFGPKGLPREAVSFINSETNKLLARADVRQQMADLGFEVKPGTPQELGEFVVSQRAKFGPILKAANIKAE